MYLLFCLVVVLKCDVFFKKAFKLTFNNLILSLVTHLTTYYLMFVCLVKKDNTFKIKLRKEKVQKKFNQAHSPSPSTWFTSKESEDEYYEDAKFYKAMKILSLDEDTGARKIKRQTLEERIQAECCEHETKDDDLKIKLMKEKVQKKFNQAHYPPPSTWFTSEKSKDEHSEDAKFYKAMKILSLDEDTDARKIKRQTLEERIQAECCQHETVCLKSSFRPPKLELKALDKERRKIPSSQSMFHKQKLQAKDKSNNRQIDSDSYANKYVELLRRLDIEEGLCEPTGEEKLKLADEKYFKETAKLFDAEDTGARKISSQKLHVKPQTLEERLQAGCWKWKSSFRPPRSELKALDKEWITAISMLHKQKKDDDLKIKLRKEKAKKKFNQAYYLPPSTWFTSEKSKDDSEKVKLLNSGGIRCFTKYLEEKGKEIPNFLRPPDMPETD